MNGLNLTVRVSYNLSALGQKAALLAGRCARAQVSEEMPLTDAAQLADVDIYMDGSLYLDATKLYFDAPPDTLADLLAAWLPYDMAERAKSHEAAAQQEGEELDHRRRVLALSEDYWRGVRTVGAREAGGPGGPGL